MNFGWFVFSSLLISLLCIFPYQILSFCTHSNFPMFFLKETTICNISKPNKIYWCTRCIFTFLFGGQTDKMYCIYTCVYIFDGVVCIKSRQTDRQSEMDGMGFPIQFVYCLCEIRDVTVYSSRSYSTCSSAAQCILFKQFTSFSFSHFSIFGLDLKQRAYDCCMLHDSIYFYWKL